MDSNELYDLREGDWLVFNKDAKPEIAKIQAFHQSGSFYLSTCYLLFDKPSFEFGGELLYLYVYDLAKYPFEKIHNEKELMMYRLKA